MSQPTDPFILAAREIVQRGSTPVTELERLLETLATDAGVVRWIARFSRPVPSEPARLHLVGDADVAVPCVRCLESMDQHVEIDREFQLVRDEARAAAMDEEASDHDVLAVDEGWDLLELIQDEVMLVLPLMPRHENCDLVDHGQADDEADSQADQDRRFPFAGLAAQFGLSEPAGLDGDDSASGNGSDSNADKPGTVSDD